jgi:hypothetical protein
MTISNEKINQILEKLASEPKIIEFGKALENLDVCYVEPVTTSLKRNFVWLSNHREENTVVHNMLLYSYMSLYEGLARHLDDKGINKLVPFELFTDYPFLETSKLMDYENELFIEAGMYPSMVHEYWKIIDTNKKQIIGQCSKDFRFQDYTIPRHLGYLGPRPGNSWVDRLVSGIAGAAAVGLNVVGGTVATCGTLGLAAPVAVPLVAASVTAGVVGLGHAFTGGLTP